MLKKRRVYNLKKQKPVLVVHGGAGTWLPERSQSGLIGVRRAARAAFSILVEGGEAVDSVMEAVLVMEDDSTFNAGYGSSLNFEGTFEMEAAIMDGKTLEAGATGLLRDIKNPIRLARIVMERTDHVFIVGKGAEMLAKIHNLKRRSPMTRFRAERHKQQKEALLRDRSGLTRIAELVKNHPRFFDLETVGAVAIDKNENVAAATSTGGFPLKLPGRIGDSPLIGCGTYADNQAGACSATGIGEIAIRLVLAKAVCSHMENGKAAQEAAELGIRSVNTRLPAAGNSMGLIAIDTAGRIGIAHNSQNLCWAYVTPETEEPKAYLTAQTDM